MENVEIIQLLTGFCFFFFYKYWRPHYCGCYLFIHWKCI